MVKRCQNMNWVKKDLFGCFRIEEIRDKDNETGLKEGGGIEMSTTVLFHIRDARSPSLLNVLTIHSRRDSSILGFFGSYHFTKFFLGH